MSSSIHHHRLELLGRTHELGPTHIDSQEDLSGGYIPDFGTICPGFDHEETRINGRSALMGNYKKVPPRQRDGRRAVKTRRSRLQLE